MGSAGRAVRHQFAGHRRDPMIQAVRASRLRFFVGLVVVAQLTACATTPSRLPVLGPESGIARLVGSWEGEYSSEQTGRSGTIAFTLRAGTDTAVGEVLMKETSREPVRTDDGIRSGIPATAHAVLPLTIRFVQIDSGQVIGELDPYADPRCGCQLRTRFAGVLTRDAIDGSFRSEGNEFFHQPTTGSWRVHRVPVDSAQHHRSR